MDLGNPTKNSFLYKVLHRYVGFLHNKIYYKRAVYTGAENLPKDKPVLFAPNHQNSLMDPLALLFSQSEELVFLARGDIFAKPKASKALIYFKILPVFRIRDGKEKLKLNEVIFDKVIEIIKTNRVVTIFPEGHHTGRRKLAALKKGIQRTAFLAEERNDYSLDTKILPIGIYYSNYKAPRSKLLLQYGEAINVSDFFETYKENKSKAVLELKKEMQKRITALMINIKDGDRIETFETLREIFDAEMIRKLGLPDDEPLNKFKADKKTIEAAEKMAADQPDEFDKLHEDVQQYQKGLDKFRLKDWVLEKKTTPFTLAFQSVILMLGFPLFVYGFINNILQYRLPRLVTKNLKDKQFTSSINFAISAFAFPIFYLIQYGITFFFCDLWYIRLAYLVTLLPAGMLAFGYHRFFVKFTARLRFVSNQKNPEMQKLQALRAKIFVKMNEASLKMGL